MLFQSHPEIGVGGLRGFKGVLGIQQGGLQLLIAHNQDHAIRMHRRTRLDEYLIYAAIRLGWDQEGVFGDQGAQATDFEDHGTALDGIRPQRGEFYARCGGFQVSLGNKRDPHPITHGREGGE